MIGIMLLTYQRTEYAMQTLAGLHTWFRTESLNEPVRLHIADDGSNPEHRVELLNQAERYKWLERVTISNSERRGYGANYNLGTQELHRDCDIILPLEDDWRLLRDLHVGHLAAVLREDPLIDCIRLGYVGWTQPLIGKFHGSHGQTYLLLDQASPEPHVFAGHPRLETRDYERRIGPWPEGLRAGATEFEVAQRKAARQGVAWPADLVHPRGDLFAHIGTVPSDEPVYGKEAADAL